MIKLELEHLISKKETTLELTIEKIQRLEKELKEEKYSYEELLEDIRILKGIKGDF